MPKAKKNISTLIKLSIFGGITIIAIIYVANQSSVSTLSPYVKQEVVKPNKDKNAFGGFFSSEKKTTRRNAEENDDVSLMGGAGRYEEARIGK